MRNSNGGRPFVAAARKVRRKGEVWGNHGVGNKGRHVPSLGFKPRGSGLF